MGERETDGVTAATACWEDVASSALDAAAFRRYRRIQLLSVPAPHAKLDRA